MIVCPNCNHPNPVGAQACEACYTPLPVTTSCPNCGSAVQTDASFCGQCGFNLRSSSVKPVEAASTNSPKSSMPDLVQPDPLVQPEPLMTNSQAFPSGSGQLSTDDPEMTSPGAEKMTSEQPVAYSAGSPPLCPPPSARSSTTQLQQQTARLFHVQTDTVIELPQNLSVVHIGKPNERIPPDIDVSGFPNSEIVSRVHADIRPEGDAYYIEDIGSSNGTYINNLPLSPGNRHRLRPGDRIALGKGDLVTFLFQLS